MSQARTASFIAVAHTDHERRAQASALLREADFPVVSVVDGESARVLLESGTPPVLLVADVALGNPRFYELCELIADRALDTKVLLVASVHTKDAYKRAPTNLYGADDYVEEHKLEESLISRVRSVLGQG